MAGILLLLYDDRDKEHGVFVGLPYQDKVNWGKCMCEFLKLTLFKDIFRLILCIIMFYISLDSLRNTVHM